MRTQNGKSDTKEWSEWRDWKIIYVELLLLLKVQKPSRLFTNKSALLPCTAYNKGSTNIVICS